MGAWGVEPLQNDTALDFLDALRKAGKSQRLARVQAAVDAYRQFHRKLEAGANVNVLSEADVADLWHSFHDTHAWYRSIGEAPPLDLLPEMADETAYAAWIEELRAPQVDEGSNEASQLLASAHVLLEALDRSSGLLAHLGTEQLRPIARDCAQAIGLLMGNTLYARTWSPTHYQALAEHARGMAARLAPA